MWAKFVQSPDWIIEASLGPEFQGFNQALYDAVSTMPPRGSADTCPSTYWIDCALKGMDQQPQHPARPFLEGNATALFTDGKVVRAHSIYDVFSDEVMSVVDFRDVLRQWRDAVGAARHDGRCGPSKEHYSRLDPPAFSGSAPD